MSKSPSNNAKDLATAYLEETRSWETDKVIELTKSRRTAWWVASVAGGLAIMSVTAVVLLTPLKTTEPFVIRVDNSTGIVDVVKTLKTGETNYDEAVNKYFVQLYVRHREGFNKETAAENYYSVGILSSANEQQKYQDFFTPKNARSPLNVYGQYAKVRISVKGVSFVKSNVALVRYSREIERNGEKPEVSHWAATVTFKYLGTPMAEKDRAFNPLGFQVVDYRSDPESLTAVEQKNYRRPEPTLAMPETINEDTQSSPPDIAESAASATGKSQ